MSRAIRDMFAGISGRYDLANDILSFGAHRLWRNRAVRCLQLGQRKSNLKILDLCCGTGDLALELHRVLSASRFGGGLAKTQTSSDLIVGADFVPEMLTLAEQKKRKYLQSLDASTSLSFVVCDALKVPFPDKYFDVISIGFGVRNVDSPENCLAELRRVLKPGGQVLILEFGKPTLPGFSALYYLYSRYLMPIIGGLATGNMSAYKYLPETAWHFPAGQNFLNLLRQAGFENCGYSSLFGGIAYIYTGIIPAITPASEDIAFQSPKLQSRG